MRGALRWVIIAGVLFVLIVGAMVLFEEKLIFFPTTADQDWLDGGEGVEDVWFEADDGTRLHAWLLEHENPRAVVLFAHGNAGNLSHRRSVIRWLRDKLRVSVMVFIARCRLDDLSVAAGPHVDEDTARFKIEDRGLPGSALAEPRRRRPHHPHPLGQVSF